MLDVPILLALISISAVFPVFWLAVLLYRRNPVPVVILYLSIQILLAAYLLMDILPGLFPETAFSAAPLRPRLMLGIRAVLFFLLPWFMHHLLCPPRATGRTITAALAALALLGVTAFLGKAVPPSHLPWPGGLLFSVPYLLLAAYIAHLLYSHRNKLQNRRVRALVLFFAVLFPAHCAAALLRDYSGMLALSPWIRQLLDSVNALSFLLWNLAFLFFLTRFLELKPIPLDSFPAIPLPASGALGISERERDVITLLVRGESRKSIAEKLFISELTVKTHIRNIYGKLDVKNRVELALLFKENR